LVGRTKVSKPGKRQRHSHSAAAPSIAVFLDVDLSGLGPLLKLYRSGNEPIALMHQLQQQWGMQWVGHYLDFA